MSTLGDVIQYRREQRATGKVTEMPKRGTDLVYREDASPPFDAWDQIRRDREFQRTWDHKRTDLSDQSTESYDLAIAGLAIHAGWTDQHVVDLLIFHRVQQVEPLRFDGSYYVDVLARAKSVGEAGAAAGGDPDAPESLAALNRALKIDIRKIVKYGGNGGTYELQLADGHRVDLGDAKSLLSQGNVRAAVLDATNAVLPAMKSIVWDKIAEKIAKCAGPAPIEEAPELEEMRWFLDARLRSITLAEIHERDRAALAGIIRQAKKEGQWAFRNQDEGGRILVRLGGLLAAIRLNHGILLSFKEAGKRMRQLGWRRRDLDGLDSKGRPCINVWEAPRDWETAG